MKVQVGQRRIHEGAEYTVAAFGLRWFRDFFDGTSCAGDPARMERDPLLIDPAARTRVTAVPPWMAHDLGGAR